MSLLEEDDCCEAEISQGTVKAANPTTVTTANRKEPWWAPAPFSKKNKLKFQVANIGKISVTVEVFFRHGISSGGKCYNISLYFVQQLSGGRLIGLSEDAVKSYLEQRKSTKPMEAHNKGWHGFFFFRKLSERRRACTAWFEYTFFGKTFQIPAWTIK